MQLLDDHPEPRPKRDREGHDFSRATSARKKRTGLQPLGLAIVRKFHREKKQLPPHYKIFTARAANKATVISEMTDCTIIRILAQADNTGQSVGEKAVLVLKARKR
jgi:hypothetical protein